MSNLFRIHIRPRGGNTDMYATFQYCLANGVLGVGWRVDEINETEKWEVYERLAAWHDSLQQPRYIYDNVKPGDLVWTRDPDGRYFLARVRSGWEYWTTPAGREMDIDIANVFRCTFHEVPLDAVPGCVVSSFGFRGRSIQQIHDTSARTYSQHLWNGYSGEQVYDVDMADLPGIFTMLDSEETEDLVFLYLQSRGWYVVPNSRKSNTLRFEFMLADARTGEKALTQVKTGHVRLNIDSYSEHPWRIFLFQSNEYYDGQRADNVTCISCGELAAFFKFHIHLFPQSFRKKLDMVNNRRIKFPMQRVKQIRPTGCGFACIAMLAHTTYEKVQQRATQLKLSIGTETGGGFRMFPCHLSTLAAAYGLRFSSKVEFSRRFRDNGLSLAEFECHMMDRKLGLPALVAVDKKSRGPGKNPNWHWVVWDNANGRVLDPAREWRRKPIRPWYFFPVHCE